MGTLSVNDQVFSDDFASATVSPSYDDNGNLTQDAWFQYTYDAWNRLVKVTTRHDARTISTQAYDGTGRRIKKVVSNSGTRNGTEYYYYAGQQMIEIYEIF